MRIHVHVPGPCQLICSIRTWALYYCPDSYLYCSFHGGHAFRWTLHVKVESTVHTRAIKPFALAEQTQISSFDIHSKGMNYNAFEPCASCIRVRRFAITAYQQNYYSSSSPTSSWSATTPTTNARHPRSIQVEARLFCHEGRLPKHGELTTPAAATRDSRYDL